MGGGTCGERRGERSTCQPHTPVTKDSCHKLVHVKLFLLLRFSFSFAMASVLRSSSSTFVCSFILTCNLFVIKAVSDWDSIITVLKSINKHLKKVHASTQSCLTPFVKGNGFRVLFIIFWTHASILSLPCRTVSMTLAWQPKFAIRFQSQSRLKFRMIW